MMGHFPRTEGSGGFFDGSVGAEFGLRNSEMAAAGDTGVVSVQLNQKPFVREHVKRRLA